MEDENRNAELAKEFFRHDLENKRQVIDGYNELIELSENISDIHGYAKKIRKTHRDIEEMAEEAEKMIESDQQTEVDIQDAIQNSLDRLHTTIEYEESNVGVNWNTENYIVETSPTVENMLYNLFDNSIEHGTDDVEIEVNNWDEGLEINVDDGGDIDDWNNIFPENAESREDYPSTGSYLIDQVAENNDIDIEGSEDWNYTVKIPFNTY